jgi:serine/threonine protein kinase
MNSGEDDNTLQYEGEMIRKATDVKLKKYWYCLLGKELYVYKNKKEEKHKGMHNLVGVFIQDEEEEELDATTKLYPFSLIFPGNTTRTYYL